MADAFYGEIRLFPYTFSPANWLPCDGRELQVNQYQGLFAVIGYTFGNNGQYIFKLPNLNGRVAVGAGDDPTDIFDPEFASSGGVRSVTLSTANLPPHTHELNGVQAGQALRSTTAAGNMLTGIALRRPSPPHPGSWPYAPAGSEVVELAYGTLSPFVGGVNEVTQPHENRQPALALRWFICTYGEYFPSRP